MSAINTHLQALASARDLDRTQEALSRTLNRLSSGNKIVRPADDAGALAVSEKISAQTQRLRSATTNVQNAISFAQTADGYLAGLAKVLSRMGELSALARDPAQNAADTALYQTEFTGLQDQLRATVGGTTAEIGGTYDIANPQGMFSGRTLFGPNPGGIPVTTGSEPGQTAVIPETNFRTGSMLSLLNQDSAGAYTFSLGSAAATATIDGALQQIVTQRAALGGVQETLAFSGTKLSVESENLSAALSRIRDVDVATESTQLAKYKILAESGTARLTQANHDAQNVLKLLRS